MIAASMGRSSSLVGSIVACLLVAIVDTTLVELFRTGLVGPCMGVWASDEGQVLIAATEEAVQLNCTTGSCTTVWSVKDPDGGQLLALASHSTVFVFGTDTTDRACLLGSTTASWVSQPSTTKGVNKGRCAAVAMGRVAGSPALYIFIACEGWCVELATGNASLDVASCSGNSPTSLLYYAGFLYVGLETGFDVFKVTISSINYYSGDLEFLVHVSDWLGIRDFAISTDGTLAVGHDNGIDFYDASNAPALINLAQLVSPTGVTAIEFDGDRSVFYFTSAVPEIVEVSLSSVQAGAARASRQAALKTDSGAIFYVDGRLNVCDGSEFVVFDVATTDAPATDSPPTDAPPTVVPTDAPITDSPPTDAPPTVVPTDAPITDSPPTDAPLTVVPTDSPVTDSPPTDAPPTVVPTSAVPPTGAPPAAGQPTAAPVGSASPRVDAPASDEAPPTAAHRTATPASVAPEVEEGEPAARGSASLNLTDDEAALVKMNTESPAVRVAERAEQGYPAMVAGSIVSTSASTGGAASRLLLITAGCNVRGADDKLPRVFHPTGLFFGGSRALWVVLGNFGLLAASAALCFLLLQFAQAAGQRAFPTLFEGLDTQGFVRIPSAPLMVFTFLYQGTTYGAVMLLMEPPDPVGFCVGFAAFVFCSAVPVGIAFRVQRAVPAKAVYLRDSVYKGRVWSFLIGPGEWVSVRRANHWVNRYASVVRTYRQETVLFSLIEYGSMFSLAAVSAARVEGPFACGHVKLFSGFVFLVQLVAEAALLPHERGRNNVFDFVFLACQAAGLLCMAAGFYLGDVHHWSHRAAEVFFWTAWGTLAVRVLCDLLTELFVLVKGRRDRLQNKAFGLGEAGRDGQELLETGKRDDAGRVTVDNASDSKHSRPSTLKGRGAGRGGVRPSGGSFQANGRGGNHSSFDTGAGSRRESAAGKRKSGTWESFPNSSTNEGPVSPLLPGGFGSSFDTCDGNRRGSAGSKRKSVTLEPFPNSPTNEGPVSPLSPGGNHSSFDTFACNRKGSANKRKSVTLEPFLNSPTNEGQVSLLSPGGNHSGFDTFACNRRGSAGSSKRKSVTLEPFPNSPTNEGPVSPLSPGGNRSSFDAYYGSRRGSARGNRKSVTLEPFLNSPTNEGPVSPLLQGGNSPFACSRRESAGGQRKSIPFGSFPNSPASGGPVSPRWLREHGSSFDTLDARGPVEFCGSGSFCAPGNDAPTWAIDTHETDTSPRLFIPPPGQATRSSPADCDLQLEASRLCSSGAVGVSMNPHAATNRKKSKRRNVQPLTPVDSPLFHGTTSSAQSPLSPTFSAGSASTLRISSPSDALAHSQQNRRRSVAPNNNKA